MQTHFFHLLKKKILQDRQDPLNEVSLSGWVEERLSRFFYPVYPIRINLKSHNILEMR